MAFTTVVGKANMLLGIYLATMGFLLLGATLRSTRREVALVWADIWIGVFWDRHKAKLYVCPVPWLVFIFSMK